MVLEDLTATLPSLSMFISRQREQSNFRCFTKELPAQLYQDKNEAKAERGGVHTFKAWITFMGAMNVIEAHACVKTKQVDLAKQQAMKGWPS